MIPLFYLFELFPVFICANNTGSLINSLFEVNIFNPFPYFISSSPSSTGMSDKSTDSSSSVIIHFQTTHHNYMS